jgi:hypothetical protein
LIVLDENILDGQRVRLEAWRLAVKQIGFDFGRKGLKDDELWFYCASTATRHSSREMRASMRRVCGTPVTA